MYISYILLGIDGYTDMRALVVYAAIAGQTKYLGPSLNLELNETRCSGLLQPLDRPDATVTPIKSLGTVDVLVNKCSLDPQAPPSTLWQNVNGKVACSCRDDYPAYVVLSGPTPKDPCETFEAGYVPCYAGSDAVTDTRLGMDGCMGNPTQHSISDG